MRASILRIDQSYPLERGDVQNFLVIQLPTGAVVRAEIDDEATTKVLEARGVEVEQPDGNGQSISALQASTGTQAFAIDQGFSVDASEPEQSQGVVEQVFRDPNDELVNWARLSPEQLSPLMKNTFKKLGVPDRLTARQIEELVNTIAEGMHAEEETQQPTPAGKLQPPTVSVHQNRRTTQNIPPIRTVRKDEMGNPIVPNSARVDSDPGEVVGDVDEDGVDQL